MRVHRSSLAATLLLSTLVPLAGCEDAETLTAQPGAGGAGAAGGATTTSISEGGGGAGGAGGEGGSDPLPPSDPEPLPVVEWIVGKVKSASSDKVFAAIDDGTFELPAPGADYLGVTWKSVAPGENGQIEAGAFDLVYAAARVTLPAGHHAFARGDTVAGFYVNGAWRHPGDFYHSGAIRVPLGADPGENLIVVRALGRRATPEVALWSTTSEVVIQTADVTSPELVRGTQATTWIGVPVMSLTAAPVKELALEVLESEHFVATKSHFAGLAPRAMTQVAFALAPKAPWASAGETIPVSLRVSSPDLAWTYEASGG